MRDACILYIHPNSWHGVPARQRYLMEAMARYLPVVYIAETERRRWRVTREQVADNVTVIDGLMPMWLRFERRGWLWAQHVAARRYLGWVRRRYRHVILWDAHNYLRSYRFVPHDTFVYDCIDPCFSDDPAELAAFDRRVQDYLTHADLVFASADLLAEQCRRHNPRVVLLNNACAPQEYDPALLDAAPRPAWWPAGGAPVAAYLGTLDARFDWSVVEHACRVNPGVHFVLAGTVLPEFQSRADALSALPNVTCPGRISVEAGRYLLSRCTIGLIPFTPGPMNDAINPVKMYAYALLGKPMVGTAIRELTARPDVVCTARTAEVFAGRIVTAIRQASDPATTRRLQAYAHGNTWRARAVEAWRHVEPLVADVRPVANPAAHPA